MQDLCVEVVGHPLIGDVRLQLIVASATEYKQLRRVMPAIMPFRKDVVLR